MSQKILFKNQQKEFGPLLKLNDRLREVLRDIQNINVCTIIVVGDQSHGKTSVIERLTAISLPRGNQIQTRAPTEIRIKSIEGHQQPVHTISYKAANNEKKSQEFELENLSDLVRDIQTEMTGNDWDISFEPIYIEIQKRNHKDMTIIDLPGVTRVLKKNQQNNIEKQILDLYKKYMEPEETIIINISNIMVDLDTSASFQLSNKIDENGERTILCFTKIDQYREKGIRQKIEYQIDKFNIDIENVFLIRNRTQEEAENCKDLEFVAEQEIELLNTNPELQQFPDTMKGIQSLSKKVVALQKEKIIINLNKTHKMLQSQLLKYSKESLKLGKNLKTVQEVTQTIHQNLGKIMAKIRNHYDCVNIDESLFTERYYPKTIFRDEITLDPKFIKLKCKIESKTNEISFELIAQQKCRVRIEVRDAKDFKIKSYNLLLDKGKTKNKITEKYEKNFIKINLYQNVHGDNIFSKYWKNEEVFISRINNLYKLGHFINKSYLQDLTCTRIKLGKGFNNVSKSNSSFILTVLRNEILPSLDSQCQQLLEQNYEQIHEDILLKLIAENFKEFPYLQEELEDMLESFMNKQKQKSIELKNQILKWGNSCFTLNPLYQHIIDNLTSYIITFSNDFGNNFEKYNEHMNFPKNDFIDFYNMDTTQKKEINDLWEDYDEEIRTVFIIWSYWQINLIRIKESLIPMLRYQLIEYVKENIEKEFMDYLQELDQTSLKDLVKPSKSIEVKRKQLEKKQFQLQTALDEIKSFCDKYPMYRRKILKKMLLELD